jgi:photosystem II stability/assembly factor-like uncharacterized protein
MKRIALAVVLLQILASVSLAQAQVSEYNHEEDADYNQRREEWIANMHRAAPGTDWKAMDLSTREARIQALELEKAKKSGFGVLSVEQDTIAGGGLVGYWSERGSNNVCGRMHTADIDFDNNIIYAASAMGNVWKASMDDLNSWTSLNDQHRFGNICMLRVITTSKGKRILAAASGPTGVFYSDNGGSTWQNATGLSGPKNWGGFKRGVMTVDEQTVYLFGNEWDYPSNRGVSTLYRSVDAGKTFTNLGKWDYNTSLCDVWVSRDGASPAYFLKGDSLFRIQTNGSLTFTTKIVYTDDISNVQNILLQGSVKNNTVSLAIMETSSNVSTIMTSSNGGLSWIKSGEFDGWPFGSNSFKVLASNPNIIAAGSTNAFISSDKGNTWDAINDWAEYYGHESTKLHADIDGIDFIKDPFGKETQIISTDGGMYMSTDGMKTFENITLSGISTSQYYSVLTSRQSPYYIYGGAQDQGYQRARDASAGLLGMTQTISGDYGHITSSNAGKSTWCDYPGFAMLYSDAQGSTSNRSWQFRGNNHLWMPPVVADPANAQAAYIACGGSADEAVLWHLTNGASNISDVQMPFDFSGGNTNRNVSAIAFSPLDKNRAYVLTNDGQFFLSTNSAQNWTQPQVTAPGSHYFYGSVILPSAKAKSTLWIAGSGYSNPGVYVSTDFGQTFTAINSGLPNTMVFGLAATEDEKFLFAATEVGPYVYSTDTKKWYDMSLGHAPDMVYWSVDYIPALKTVRFGTYGRGIWDFTIGAAPILRNYVITAPKSGDIIAGGTLNYQIKYTAQNPGVQKKFELSYDGGTTWNSISGTGSSSPFTWSVVPDSGSTHAMIRLSDEFGTTAQSGIFTIVKKTPGPQITTLTLTPLKNGNVGNTIVMTIDWTTNGANFGSGFTVEYSLDNMVSWQKASSVAATVLKAYWTTPDQYYPHCFIRVRGTDADKSSIEQISGEFSIGSPATIHTIEKDGLVLWNYPNPLSGRTTFGYSLSEPCVISFTLYDMKGAEVASLISNKMETSGLHTIDFNAANLRSGSYTYVLTAGSKRITAEMEVVK